jgi:RNA 2',3'-cyclic 3'-phosphodiesterase
VTEVRGWRLFVALDLPYEVRATLVGWRNGVLGLGPDDGVGDGGDAGLRPVERDQLHVTLCFLGLCQPESVEAIGRACSVLRWSGRALLRLGDAVWLPRRRPRVLAVAVADLDGKLARTQAALAQSLAQIGAYREEARAFLPHVTVARVRRGEDVRALDVERPPPIGFEGDLVTLYHSVPGPSGTRYEGLHSVEL